MAALDLLIFKTDLLLTNALYSRLLQGMLQWAQWTMNCSIATERFGIDAGQLEMAGEETVCLVLSLPSHATVYCPCSSTYAAVHRWISNVSVVSPLT